MIHNEARFQQLIEAAAAAEFKGWDFSWLRGRSDDPDPFWSYRQLVLEALPGKTALLDMGTGGGEFLASLAPYPPGLTVSATEGYPPNIPVAQARLNPLGVTVYPLTDDTTLPLPDQTYDLIINRHESYDLHEVKRVLKPGGIFVTQQVGGANDRELVRDLTGELPGDDAWSLVPETARFRAAGFEIIKQAEGFLPHRFFDIGAVVYYLRAISWLVPDFSITTYRAQLGDLHNRIESGAGYAITSHRFLIEARVSL